MSTAPPSLDQQINAALGHHRRGELAQAEAIYRAVLATDPNNADALHLLGLVAHQVGQHQHAEQLIARAIRIHPGNAQVHLNHAKVLVAAGRPHDALASLQTVLRLDPSQADAYAELGWIFHQRGDFASAAECLRTVTTLRPDDAAAFHNLCAELVTLKRWPEAAAAGKRAVELRPDWPDAWCNYGAALYRIDQLDDSVAAYRRAIALRPVYADAYANLALTLLEQYQFAEAEAACREAIRLTPGGAQAWSNLGNTLKKQSKLPEALAAYRKSLELNPRNRSSWANVLLALSYLDTATPEEILATHRAWAEQYAEPLVRELDRLPAVFANSRDPERRLRIGYVSPDFFQHAVMHFLEPLLVAHDRAAVEIFCYSDVDRPDAVTDRIRHTVTDHWRDVAHVSDADLADIIRRDGIDVLVDLAGHTRRNRLITFALRAAPVKLSYLGYPATTGLPAMDYRLTDGEADPRGMTDAHFTEKLIRLSRCAWCYHPPEGAPPPAPQPPCIASGFVTFGSFNKHLKISPSTLDAWARLLRTVINSRLLLKSNRLRDEVSRQRLIGEFTERGIEAGRVEVLPPTASAAEHLATYARVDVALDTFPYNGTTTTCDALYMGVPVVALAGRTHVSRVGVSLLAAVGLPELVADDVEQYIFFAAELARDTQRLSRLRRDLRPRMASSPLMDAPSLARATESAYRDAWRDWCAS